MDARSTMKPKLLRNPGQSLEERIDHLVNDKFLAYFLFAGMFWLLAAMEWIVQLTHRPPAPGAFALAAACASAVTAWQFWRIRRNVRYLKQGRDGEREVAELLEDLKVAGAHVIHDVPANNFNVDHVIVSTRGIYAVETKNWSKSKGRSRIEFDGRRITVSGKALRRDPVTQCRAQACWVRDFLKESTSKRLPVRGVVVFPRWWVEQLPTSRGCNVWVLNPKSLSDWIAREPEMLNQTDAAMAAMHLRQHVRNA